MSGLDILDYVGPSPKQWQMTIRGARNSWQSWEKGDSTFDPKWPDDGFILGEKDRDLCLRLAWLGNDHAKYLRQLPVIVDLKAPGYWWREFDTYRVGVTPTEPPDYTDDDDGSDVTQNSTSMMHTLGREVITEAMIYMGDVPALMREDMLGLYNDLRLEWIHNGKRKGPECAEWRALQQAIGYGWLYTRTVSLNYQVLRSMYLARKNHRLAEWRTLCAWCETLDYSELLTTTKETK